MPQSEEAAAWFAAVYEMVQQIPHGRVTSYGHIARLLDYRVAELTVCSSAKIKSHARAQKAEDARQVGVCLKHLPSEGQFHNGNVPWQRVINSRGCISPRGPGAAERQAGVLEAEGVQVDRNAMGEFMVDFATYGWFPDHVEL